MGLEVYGDEKIMGDINFYENVGFTKVGHHMAENSGEGHLHFLGHNEFLNGLTFWGPQIINAYDFTERVILQPDNSGTWTGTEQTFQIVSPAHLLANNGYLQTDSVAATQPIRYRIYEGEDDTGTLIFDQTYPASLFSASTELQFIADGYIEFDTGETYFHKITSDANFSLKMDTTDTTPWFASDISSLREDDIFSTKHWVSGDSFTVGDYCIESNKIYICNVTGEQTGTFASNSAKWHETASTELKTPTPYGLDNTNLMGYWAGNGNTKDYSGYGNDGTLVGDATYSDGLFGKAFEFGGSGGFNVPRGNINLADDFTIVMWVNANDLSGRNRIFSTREASGSFALEVGEGQAGTNTITVSAPSVWACQAQNNVISENKWYLIAYTKEGINGDQEIYVNGIKQTLVFDQEHDYTNVAETIYIGSQLNGSMDDIMVFDRILTAGELLSFYSVGNKFKTSGDGLMYDGNVNVTGNLTIGGEIITDTIKSDLFKVVDSEDNDKLTIGDGVFSFSDDGQEVFTYTAADGLSFYSQDGNSSITLANDVFNIVIGTSTKIIGDTGSTVLYSPDTEKNITLDNDGTHITGVLNVIDDAKLTTVDGKIYSSDDNGYLQFGTGGDLVWYDVGNTQSRLNLNGIGSYLNSPTGVASCQATDTALALNFSDSAAIQVNVNATETKLSSPDGSNSVEVNDTETEITGPLKITSLPTEDPVDAGALWNDSGTLKVSSGS